MDVAAQRLEVRATVATEAGTTMPDSLDDTLDNTQRPYIMEEEANQTCDVTEQWPSDRDFKAEMSAFPDGPIFVRGYAPEAHSSPDQDQYNLEMQQKMKSNICYLHDAGPNYSYIIPSIICGSCPQQQSDIDHLRDVAGVTRILNLQEEHDWLKFGIDFGAIEHHCNQRGDIGIVRSPLVDFSDESLVKDLAAAVAQLKALVDGGHRVYVHCTAGLGRAPAVIIAYLHWTAGMNLEESYSFVTRRRRCHPRAAAIFRATASLATSGSDGAVCFSWLGKGDKVHVTGTWDSWQTPGLPLRKYVDDFHLSEVCLPAGIHEYKYIIDGDWRASDKAPTAGRNGNNVVLVKGNGGGGARLPPPAPQK